jgi:hypothetical protein
VCSFRSELRCSGNRRAPLGATETGEATWQLRPDLAGHAIREVGAGVTWPQGETTPSMLGPGHKQSRTSVASFVIAIRTDGAVLQRGDSDYAAIAGREGFVAAPV